MTRLSWRTTLLLLGCAALLLAIAVVTREHGWTSLLLILSSGALLVATLFGKRGV